MPGGSIQWENPFAGSPTFLPDHTAVQTADDGFYIEAIDARNTVDISNNVHFTGFNFTIPGGAQIHGITITVRRRAVPDAPGDSVVRDFRVAIIYNGTTYGVFANNDPNDWAESWEDAPHGGAYDDWGLPGSGIPGGLSATTVNNALFGCFLQAEYFDPGSTNPCSAQIDQLQMTIHYDEPTTTSTTSTSTSTTVTSTSTTVTSTTLTSTTTTPPTTSTSTSTTTTLEPTSTSTSTTTTPEPTSTSTSTSTSTTNTSDTSTTTSVTSSTTTEAYSSSCSAAAFDPRGREGIGVVQPQSGIDYPLVGVPSDDIRYLLADLSLTYDDAGDYNPSETPFTPPFSIAWMYGFGCLASDPPDGMEPTHEADVLIVDDDGRTVFDSTTATEFTSRPWGDRLHLYGWKTADATLWIVIHTTWSDAVGGPEPQQYAWNIIPDSAVIDARAIERLPKRVKSMQVVLDTLAQKRRVNLAEGYNIAITDNGESTTDGGRRRQRLTISATPGAGLGVYPGCDPASLIVTSLNNINPTAEGDFYLAAGGCYYIRQPAELVTETPRTTSVTESMLIFGNDCTPCCSCDDYVDVARYLNKTRNSYNRIGQKASQTRTLYHQDRERWLDSKCCFDSKPLRLALQPQICPFLDIAGQICNSTQECYENVQLFFNIGVPADFSVTGTQVERYTTIRGQAYKAGRRNSTVTRYQMGGSWPNFTATFDRIEPGTSGWVKFRLQFSGCGQYTFNQQPYVIDVLLSGSIDGVGVRDETECAEDVGDLVIYQQAVLRCPAEAADVHNPTICVDPAFLS